MKKTISLLSILLVLAVLLSACAGEPEPTTVPTTEPTVAPTTEPMTASTTEPMTEPATKPTTEPTVEPTTEPDWESFTQPTAAQSENGAEVEYYQQLLDFRNGNDRNGYNAALNCVFENPEDLDLNLYFWTHFVLKDDWEDFTEDEASYLIAHGLNREHDAQKRPAEMLDAVLQVYFGQPLSAFPLPSNWIYYEETDCYYTTGTSPLIRHQFEVTEIEHAENGTVMVYYQFELYMTEKYVLTLQEKRGEGETGYYILSHLPVTE